MGLVLGRSLGGKACVDVLEHALLTASGKALLGSTGSWRRFVQTGGKAGVAALPRGQGLIALVGYQKKFNCAF